MSTILLVDDEPDLLDLYTDVLEVIGYQVIHAHDGLEALEKARQQRPDLIVTDWMMPHMDGVELCLRLLHEPGLEGVPIILHSTRRAPRIPGVHVLSKSCPLDEFEDAVARAIDKLPEPLLPPPVHATEGA
ncbi:response regulator [Vitiosangium sp. GDMCC 1.1324]|uniref:response regulator n=1 Tax=Vitiosangium sp. (strain GDMCC 1.1324) TaxID=2138576 RepID=UPI000D3C1E88|nr:response regulator [Vitiosangium sp. GDMCC 1.1324]PTL81477.1 two-component system response regulator [Vitiosangium sp. GDMCC 1.1324]